MKILFLTHRLPYAPNRGDRIRAYFLLQEMSRFAKVSLFSLVHDDDAARAGEVPFAANVVTARVTKIANHVRGALRLATSKPLTHSLLDAPSAKVDLARMVAADRPDLVVAFCSSMAKFALDPALAPLPMVLDMVDVDSVKWAAMARESRGPMRWIYQREARCLGAFEAMAAKHARVTLVVNDRERDALHAVAPGVPVVVQPNGVDLHAFQPQGEPANDPTVVFCGVMDYAPNVSGMLWFAQDVWPRVLGARPEARLRIVGANPTGAISALAAGDSSIEVTGTVPSVQPYLWSSAVAIAPLHIARGVQMKALEAIAAGLPVVGTTAVKDGLPVEAAPAYCVADNAADFARAVIQFLAETPQARRQRAERARLEALTWQRRLAPLERLLKEAAGTHGAAVL